jgi:hypothetical protein
MLEYKLHGDWNYVRIAPTTFFRVPACYQLCLGAAECELCAVKAQCREAQDDFFRSRQQS